jgi:phospholipid transport system transporter-binding protein
VISRDGDSMVISGRLTMETVAALFKADLRPRGSDLMEIDFGQVEAVDSAAVSLLLCWLRRAQRDNVRLSFLRLPGNLLSLAHLYDVAKLLPTAGDAPAMQS